MRPKPINAKNFMEFFENQCGVKFVDISTGKNALDLINEREKINSNERACGNCKYGAKGDGIFAHTEDIVCVNSDSPNTTEFVFADSNCDHWERGGSTVQ